MEAEGPAGAAGEQVRGEEGAAGSSEGSAAVVVTGPAHLPRSSAPLLSLVQGGKAQRGQVTLGKSQSPGVSTSRLDPAPRMGDQIGPVEPCTWPVGTERELVPEEEVSALNPGGLIRGCLRPLLGLP